MAPAPPAGPIMVDANLADRIEAVIGVMRRDLPEDLAAIFCQALHQTI